MILTGSSSLIICLMITSGISIALALAGLVLAAAIINELRLLMSFENPLRKRSKPEHSAAFSQQEKARARPSSGESSRDAKEEEARKRKLEAENKAFSALMGYNAGVAYGTSKMQGYEDEREEV